MYGVCQMFVNLTNTFDVPEMPEEMKKLGEFAKVKMPTLAEKVLQLILEVVNSCRFSCLSIEDD